METTLGRFRIAGLIGKGGMGQVWRAFDPTLGREVAVKTLAADAAEPESIERFKREAHEAARLRHPRIVAIHEFGTAPDPATGRDVHFIVMDLIEGASMAQELDAGPMRPARLVPIVAEIAEALGYAHRHGVVHRDVKPGNILIDKDGGAFLADFGLARDARPEGSDRLTVSGTVIGTYAYMSPEQARGRSATAGPASDVYSLGATLYQGLTGRLPIDKPNPYDQMHAILVQEPTPPPVERELQWIVMKCLEKEASRRYRDGADLAADLRRFLAGDPIAARPASLGYRLRRQLRRRPAVWTLAALLALAIAGGAAFGISQLVRAARAQEKALAEARRSERRARAQACVDEARALLADVKGALYMEGCSLGPYLKALDGVGEKCDEALRQEPGYAPAWFWKGKAALLEGRYDEAVASLEKAAARPDAPGYMWAELGRAWLERAQYLNRVVATSGARGRDDLAKASEEARRCYAKAGDLGRGLEAQVLEGYRLWGEADWDGMRRLAEAGLKEYESRPGVEDFAFLLACASDAPERVEHWTRAVRLRPGFYAAYLNRGAEREKLGDMAGAEEDYARAVEIHPKCAEAHNNRGAVRRHRGDLPGALEDLDRAIALGPTLAAPYVNRGVVRMDLKDFPGAIEDFDFALRLDPSRAETFANRAGARAARGDLRGAVEDLSRAVELRPSFARAWFDGGKMRHLLGDFAGAVRDFTEAIKHKGDFAEAYYRRALARQDGGERDGPLADFDEAIRLDPGMAAAYVDRGALRGELGDAAGARQDFDRAVELDPALPEARANRGMERAGRGDLDGARSDLREALRLAPEGWPNRAAVRRALEDVERRIEGKEF